MRILLTVGYVVVFIRPIQTNVRLSAELLGGGWLHLAALIAKVSLFFSHLFMAYLYT